MVRVRACVCRRWCGREGDLTHNGAQTRRVQAGCVARPRWACAGRATTAPRRVHLGKPRRVWRGDVSISTYSIGAKMLIVTVFNIIIEGLALQSTTQHEHDALERGDRGAADPHMEGIPSADPAGWNAIPAGAARARVVSTRFGLYKARAGEGRGRGPNETLARTERCITHVPTHTPPALNLTRISPRTYSPSLDHAARSLPTYHPAEGRPPTSRTS